MTTPYSSEVCLYRSEGFAEDLLDTDGLASPTGLRCKDGVATRSTSSAAGHGAALLCAVPLGAAVLGAAASAWGWMV